MDKEQAIQEAYEKRKRESEANFQTEVTQLIWDIEDTSNKLRNLKIRLMELKYEEPEVQGGVLTPKAEEKD